MASALKRSPRHRSGLQGGAQLRLRTIRRRRGGSGAKKREEGAHIKGTVDNDHTHALAPYAQGRVGAALADVATSVVAYLALSAAMYLTLDVSIWLTLALAIPTGGFLLRTFIVFHDCGHGSFLPSKRGNRWLGRFTALLVWQTFANWRHDHAVHHGTAGDLDRRGQGDVPTWTVNEYYERPWHARLGYRLFRSPLVMVRPVSRGVSPAARAAAVSSARTASSSASWPATSLPSFTALMFSWWFR